MAEGGRLVPGKRPLAGGVPYEDAPVLALVPHPFGDDGGMCPGSCIAPGGEGGRDPFPLADLLG